LFGSGTGRLENNLMLSRLLGVDWSALRLAGVATAGALALGVAPAAFADAKSEAFVQSNAASALQVLNDKSLSDDARSVKFSAFMNQFAHMPSIARRVLGVHSRTLSAADFDRYFKSFERYAMAVYEVRLDPFRGEAIKVTGSTDLDPSRSQVRTTIRSAQSGGDVEVVWDVLMSKDGKTYRVRDVGLNLQGSMLWLAQDQQMQFESYLNRNKGDINKLIARIDQMTADLQARKISGPLSAKPKAAAAPSR
jgi:phospholipid transport system substrate-binding protein